MLPQSLKSTSLTSPCLKLCFEFDAVGLTRCHGWFCHADQKKAEVADVAEDGEEVLSENGVVVGEDVERGVGPAVGGGGGIDLLEPREWDDSGNDEGIISPEFFQLSLPVHLR